MARYKERAINAIVYRRCSSIDVRFPIAGDPVFTVHEDEVTEVDGSVTQSRGLGMMRFPVTPDNTEFELLDKQGNPTGKTMTFAKLYRALESAYADLAARRDLLPQEEPI